MIVNRTSGSAGSPLGTGEGLDDDEPAGDTQADESAGSKKRGRAKARKSKQAGKADGKTDGKAAERETGGEGTAHGPEAPGSASASACDPREGRALTDDPSASLPNPSAGAGSPGGADTLTAEDPETAAARTGESQGTSASDHSMKKKNKRRGKGKAKRATAKAEEGEHGTDAKASDARIDDGDAGRSSEREADDGRGGEEVRRAAAGKAAEADPMGKSSKAEAAAAASERGWELSQGERENMMPWTLLGVEIHAALTWHLHRQVGEGSEGNVQGCVL